MTSALLLFLAADKRMIMDVIMRQLRRVLTTALVDVITQPLRGLAVKQLCHDAGTPLMGSARGCVSMKRVARKACLAAS
jgi:hypothetical protein